MKITIEIPDEEIKETLKERVVSLIVDDNRWGSDRRAFRREYSDIVKEMIYKPEIKNDIINRTIDVAAQYRLQNQSCSTPKWFWRSWTAERQ